MFLHKDYMPYVVTLYRQATEESVLPKVTRAAQSIVTAFSKTPELSDFVKTPFVPFEEKINLLKALFAKNTPILFISFLNVLGQNRKLSVVQSILNKFLEYADHKEGLEAVSVKSAYKLNKDMEKTIQTALEKQLKKPVQLTSKVDSSLMGGILIHYHNHDLDLSIKKSIFSLRKVLKKVYS